MERRRFLSLLGCAAGGVLLDQAIPLGRVWSFPKKIAIAGVDWGYGPDRAAVVASWMHSEYRHARLRLAALDIAKRFNYGDVIAVGPGIEGLEGLWRVYNCGVDENRKGLFRVEESIFSSFSSDDERREQDARRLRLHLRQPLRLG